MMGKRLHLPGNVHDLARRLEQLWQEIPQETIRVLYHSMPRCGAACIQAVVSCFKSDFTCKSKTAYKKRLSLKGRVEAFTKLKGITKSPLRANKFWKSLIEA
ncbi:hypothetical protein TNCV_4701351 [Trichonephila clavipes]|nr:hypothetical protein TNCV_4701351 [Trichonephila clavipes]